ALWQFRVTGDGFLWNQVRRMVSAVLAVGRGEAAVEDIARSLRSGTPHKAFRLAASEGLLLERVDYGEIHWDPVAGRLGPHLTTRAFQKAMVRMALQAHLRELAPWPEG